MISTHETTHPPTHLRNLHPPHSNTPTHTHTHVSPTHAHLIAREYISFGSKQQPRRFALAVAGSMVQWSPLFLFKPRHTCVRAVYS